MSMIDNVATGPEVVTAVRSPDRESEAARRQALVLVAVCVLAWSLIPTIAARNRDVSIDDYVLLGWASVVSALVLAGAATSTGRWPTIRALSWRQLTVLSLLGIVGSYLYYVMLFVAYDNSRYKYDVLACQYTWPVFTVVFSCLLTGERLRRRECAAMVLAFASVVLVARAQYGAGWPPFSRLVMALLSAASFGLFSALTKSRREHEIDASLIYFLAAAVVGVAVMCFRSKTIFVTSWSDIVVILITGAFVNGLSYVWWFKALSLSRAGAIAPLLMATPVVATLMMVATGVPLSVGTCFGIAGICVAGLLVR